MEYLKIRSQMAEHKEGVKELGKLIHKSAGQTSQRLLGRVQWQKNEIDILLDHYGKTYEELFKKGV